MNKRFADLERRVAELESLLQPVDGELDVALLTRLRRKPGEGEVEGAIQLAGSVSICGRRAVSQLNANAADLMALDSDAVARVLSAVSHPVRIEVLTALLEGPLTGAELEAKLDASSTGRLYHHLKELRAAGVVVQPRRSVYELPVRHVVPVLALLSLAQNLGADR